MDRDLVAALFVALWLHICAVVAFFGTQALVALLAMLLKAPEPEPIVAIAAEPEIPIMLAEDFELPPLAAPALEPEPEPEPEPAAGVGEDEEAAPSALSGTTDPGSARHMDLPGDSSTTFEATQTAKVTADARAAAIASQLSELDVRALGVLSDGAPMDGVLGSGDVPPGVLDEVGHGLPGGFLGAAAGHGLAAGGGKLSGAGDARLSRGGHGIHGVGSTAREMDRTLKPKRPAVTGAGGAKLASSDGARLKRASRGRVKLGAVSAGGGIADGDLRRALRPMRGALKRCYQRGLERNPNLEGHVSVRLSVGPGGEILGAVSLGEGSPDPTTLPDPAMVNCVLSAIRRARLPTPDDGRAPAMLKLRFSK